MRGSIMMTDEEQKVHKAFTKYDKNDKGTSRRILATNTYHYSNWIELNWIELNWIELTRLGRGCVMVESQQWMIEPIQGKFLFSANDEL